MGRKPCLYVARPPAEQSHPGDDNPRRNSARVAPHVLLEGFRASTQASRDIVQNQELFHFDTSVPVVSTLNATDCALLCRLVALIASSWLV